MDYREYQLSLQEIGKVVIFTIGITGAIGFLFYRSFGAVLFAPVLFVYLYKRMVKQKCLERQRQLQEQFMNGMRVLNTALQAGLSMENAWREVQRETGFMYGEDAYFYREVSEINHSVSLNLPIEKLVLAFSHRTGVEDIISFAEIFAYGKRSGGNWKKIIDTTVLRMCEKYDARREIEVLVAGKKMEQQVMNILPLGILAFMQISAWDYMKVLFHNPLGILFMTVCLILYVVAILFSERILQIWV